MRWLLLVLAVWCGLARAQHDHSIPITIESPPGFKSAGLRLHLAHFGAVPYGEVFPRAQVHAFDDNCTCGAFKCKTGCSDFNRAQPEDQCKPRIVQQGGLSRRNVNVVLVEEAELDVCTRSTVAFNAARAYADAVIIIARQNETELLAAVDSKSAVAQTETLQLEHVNIPIGVVTFDDGGVIKDALQDSNNSVLLKMDFQWVLPKNDAGVTIQIWHTTDDACGPACNRVDRFMSDVVEMAQHLDPEHYITVEPHFLFANCTSQNPDMCTRSCVNNNRYCYERFTNLQLFGSLIAEENIRQLCLFESLRNTESRDTRKFWLYKQFFMRNCKTSEGNFNAECSERAFASLAETPAMYEKWQRCFKDLGTENQITTAESEVKKMQSDKVSAWLGSTVVVGSEHFRGSLDLKHVMKAACESMTDELSDNIIQCTEWTQGVCTPGSEPDRDCRNPQAESEHRGQCTQSLASEVGFICSCDAGYTSVASAPGGTGGECRDVNECTVYPTLCNRGDLARNACRNTDGSFECEENINNECTPENDYGGCWRQDVGGFTVTSCVDEFAQYKESLQNGQRLGRLHRCDCEEVRGCWVGGQGICTRKCPEGNCNPLTKECDAGSSRSRGEAVAAALGVTVAVLVAIGAGIGFLVHRRNKRAKNMQDGGNSDAQTQGRYANFDGATSGHQSGRMSTGAISMGGIRDQYPGNMAPAGASIGRNGSSASGKAAAYVARTTGQQQNAFAPELVQGSGQAQGPTQSEAEFTDVSLRHASLNVQEHPES